MIQIEQLIKRFGNTVALHVEYLHIRKGEYVGIVGNNGAGKTTLLRLMLDLLKPESGSVTSKGINVYKSEHWKFYTASYIDTRFLIDFLTPDEYFGFIANLYSIETSRLKIKMADYEAFMNGELSGHAKLIRNLSDGNRQKTGIIGALIPDSEILILDEPFNFLDPRSQKLFQGMLSHLRDKIGLTVIMSSHNLHHISDVSDRIILLEKGKIIRDLENSNLAMYEIESYFNTGTELSRK